jgi:sodium-dependent dicarboxylate transporter 2/3/5
VIFVAAMLAISLAVSKTGLDKRLGLTLLGSGGTPRRFFFVFWPLLAAVSAFLSEHILIALLCPVLMVVYLGTLRGSGVRQDRGLATALLLGTCFVANQAGLGSPAAGGRNAVMIGILGDYGPAPGFWDWLSFGLPMVPVLALLIGVYFHLLYGRRLRSYALDVTDVVLRERAKLGRMTRPELHTGLVLVGVVATACLAPKAVGMGGAALIGVVALAVLRVVTWRDINRIPWEVVVLYAVTCALSRGLVETGAALWLGGSVIAALPEVLRHGPPLCMVASLAATVLTNFMSDGATVAALGPLLVPVAAAGGTHPWLVGMATAFAASFANCVVFATPTNAIVYSFARDPETGEQLVTHADFLRHGLVVTLLVLATTWGVAFFGYWRLLAP